MVLRLAQLFSKSCESGEAWWSCKNNPPRRDSMTLTLFLFVCTVTAPDNAYSGARAALPL